MKKFFIGLVMLAILAIGLPLSAEAHPGCSRHKRKAVKKSYVSRSYATRGYTYQRPSFYQRHRNTINIATATGGGALVGGLIGGNRKSMGIGALVGAGSGALYTFVLKPKKKRNY